MGLLSEIYTAPRNNKIRYSKPEEPIRYDEGSKWVAYTGPKGGKGWQHIESGQIIYGAEKPGSAGPSQDSAPPAPTPRQPAQEPASSPKSTEWLPAGTGLWQHPSTGEVVKSKESPSSGGTSSILDAARARTKHPSQEPKKPQPAAQPKTRPAGDLPKPTNTPTQVDSGTPQASEGQIGPRSDASPQAAPAKSTPVDQALAKSLDNLPDGTQLLGWTKESPRGLNMTLWTQGEKALGSGQFIEQHGTPEQQQEILGAIGNAAQARQTPPSGPQPGVPPSGKTPPRAFTPEEMQSVSAVSGIFGIAPGDLGNEQQVRQFLKRTARQIGFNPDSVPGDHTDKAISAAQFLASKQPELNALVGMAKGYGWSGGSARELALRARHAGLHLVKVAAQQGYQVTGQTEQEQIAGAMEFLHGQEAQQQQTQQASAQAITQAIKQLLSKSGGSGKRNLFWSMAMAAVGFFLGYKLMRAMQRRRQRRR